MHRTLYDNKQRPCGLRSSPQGLLSTVCVIEYLYISTHCTKYRLSMFIIIQMSKKSNVNLCKFTIEFCVLLLYNVIKVSDLIQYIYEINTKRSDLN